MATPQPPACVSAAVTSFVKRHRVLVPLLVLALARFLYRRRNGHLEQFKLQHAISSHLATGSASPPTMGCTASSEAQAAPISEAPMEEWHVVDEDGSQAQSLVYYPLESEAVPDDQKLLVLFIPGNPGVPHYYLPLMQELIARHGRRHEVRCISHAGHFMPWKNNGRVYSLAEQLQHKTYYLRARLREDPTLRFIVIGHSIGSYFALDVARQFPNQMEKLVLMQPTISHMAQSAQGKQVYPLLRHREPALSLVTALEFLVPTRVRRWIVRQVLGADTSDVLQLASVSLVNTVVMRNVLFMALHELEEVKELDEPLMRKHEDKMLFVYSPVDHWVPAESVQDYQLRFPLSQHRMVPQPHAFMMEPNGTRDMAEHISRWIGDDLDGKGQASKEEFAVVA